MKFSVLLSQLSVASNLIGSVINCPIELRAIDDVHSKYGKFPSNESMRNENELSVSLRMEHFAFRVNDGECFQLSKLFGIRH